MDLAGIEFLVRARRVPMLANQEYQAEAPVTLF